MKMLKLKRIIALLLAALTCALVSCAPAKPAEEPVNEPGPEPTEEITVVISTDPPEVTAMPPEPTAEPTPEVTPEPTPKPAPGPADIYFLYLEKGSFTLTIYKIDENGEYTEVVGQYRVSHGGNRTPVGNYVITSRERWHGFSHGENGYAQYAVMYNPASDPSGWTGLYLHGPMYGSENPNHLWPRYYDGEKAIGGENTQGCLRMNVIAAKFIYENCPKGTKLKIVNGNPLGTTSPKVPSRQGKYHDPTDPDAKPSP